MFFACLLLDRRAPAIEGGETGLFAVVCAPKCSISASKIAQAISPLGNASLRRWCTIVSEFYPGMRHTNVPQTGMSKSKKPRSPRKSAYPDREVIAKAEGRFAKADKQRAGIKTDPKGTVQREKERVGHIKKAKQKI